MTRHRKAALTTILGLVLAGSSTPARASLCGFEDVAIFALNSAHVSRDASVVGDVVANSESPGPVLDEGAEVALDRGAVVTGDVKGHTVDLDAQSTIDGDATYAELFSQGTITGAQTVAPPPYSGVPEFQAASAGGDDVVVGPGQTVVLGDELFCSQSIATACTVDSDCPLFPNESCALAPVTVYGDISISAGGRVVFAGGRSFDVRSIGPVAGGGQCPFPCRSIEFDAPTVLRVEGRIDTEKNSFVGPAAGSGIAASDVVIYSGGTNGGAGGPLDTPFAVNIGRQSVVEANLYAPFGTLEIDRDSTVTGALLGRDVEIQVRVDVLGDSAFANEVPSATAQEVLTDGADPLLITLEGSDPEGEDLSFSIEVGPSEGTLGAISPITPAPVDQCSQSGGACTVDSDCPGFAEGETCDTVQPPITQATVTYTPNLNNNCVTDPESGEVTCPEDFFTFGVTDDCGDLGTAIVSINGGTDEVADDPGSGVDVVEANDRVVDMAVSEVRVLTLSAAAPDTVAALTFRVETLPAGALQDSSGSPVVAGVDLPSPVVTYQAPASPGSDSFTFSARDASTTIPPACGPPSCDSGSVNVDVDVTPELAPDQSVTTDLNTPVEITLRANSGGTSGGGSLSAGSLGSVGVTYGDNGASFQLKDGPSGPTALGVDQGWLSFFWSGSGSVFDCPGNATLDTETEVDESPFDFTVSEDSCLRVTDAFLKGDHWRVQNVAGGNVDWTDFTSEVEQTCVSTTGDADTAFDDPEYSSGEFDLDAGTYSIRLTLIPPDSFTTGQGFIRVDTGPCIDIVWTVTTLPAANTGTLSNLDGSAVQIGVAYLEEPTLVFTPAFGFSGSTSFTYQVSQGGTVGTAVVDTATVDLVVGTANPCLVVGREPGCTPGAGAQAQAETESVEYVSELGDGDGPRDGLTLIVEGAGTVSSSPVPLKDNLVLRGLVCTRECTRQFPMGSLVRVYARPDPGSELVGWSGDCRSDDTDDHPSATVQLGENSVCTAIFRVKEEITE